MINHPQRSPVNAAIRAADFQSRQATLLAPQRSRVSSFTLVELLVSMCVLVLLVLLASQILNSAATITSLGQKQMDTDAQARQLLDRMALDFAQMVKRPDVDYYVKSSATAAPDCTTCTAQSNSNDQIAFFGATSGYYPTPSYQSPISLIAYRINSDSTSSSYNKLERMGKGFVWNGVSASYKPIPFLDNPTPTATPTTATTILGTWPAAVSNSTSDSDYEVAGSLVFRFEYYYLLKNGSFSNRPWDTGGGHANVAGMQDVAAIIADIAVIDPRSKLLLTNSQIATLNGASGQPPVLVDYAVSMTTPGQLRTNWKTALDGITNLPRAAVSGIRLYERHLYLSPPTLGTL